jgi:hypothetical protein
MNAVRVPDPSSRDTTTISLDESKLPPSAAPESPEVSAPAPPSEPEPPPQAVSKANASAHTNASVIIFFFIN